MIIDCECCEVRGDACGDCVVGVLLGVPAPGRSSAESGDGAVDVPFDAPSGAPITQLDARERRAIDVLAEQGLVPRLRLVAGRSRRATPDADAGRSIRDAG